MRTMHHAIKHHYQKYSEAVTLTADGRQYLVEGIGTFFLTLVIAFTGNPIAIGGALIALVYMGGYISGAHYNPAVTLGLLLRGAIKPMKAVTYMMCQLTGAVMAALVYFLVQNSFFVPSPGPHCNLAHMFVIETLFTFLLVSVVMHVATSKKVAGNQYYGLAIGLTVMAAAFAGGKISGGVYNPAVALGPIMLALQDMPMNLEHLLVYLSAQSFAAVLAAVVYGVTVKNSD